MTRADHLVALGGGVVGDLGGFCAHTYQRGVPVVQVPTTVVAQVDSAYGGKTGVDLPQGKNYVGAYHLPAAVIADWATIGTLPPAELAAGFVEVLKTALLAGGELWEGVRAIAEGDLAAQAVGRLRLRPLQVRGRRRRRARRGPAAGAQPRPHRRPRDRGRERLRALPPRGGDRPRAAGDPAALRRGSSSATRSHPGSSATASRPGWTRASGSSEVLAAIGRDKKRGSGGVPFVLLEQPGRPRTGQVLEPDKVEAAVEELYG